MDDFQESWVDPEEVISGLSPQPYFLNEGRREEAVHELGCAGFDVLEVDLARVRSESELLVSLGGALSAPSYYGANWDALRDVLRDRGTAAPFRFALVLSSSAAFLGANVHGFIRSVVLLQMMARDVSDMNEGCGQLEIFYLADWV
ncbi:MULTISPECIES: barstar family protein [unclassified Streptomyces]|uniref:barstar family protein n=1 Tax=unclassified Streptomyces TaxID=2593676 RepID=UPI0035D577CA